MPIGSSRSEKIEMKLAIGGVKDVRVSVRNHMRWWMLASGILCNLPTHAENLPSAELTIAEYERAPTRDTTKLYLHGVEAGLRYALAINKLNGLPVIYCRPEQLAFSSKDLVGLVDHEISVSPDFRADKNVPVAVVLLRALQHAYPCESK